MAIEDDPVLSEAARPINVETEPEEREKASGVRNIVEWVVIAGGALLVAFIIKTFLLQAFYIPSLSMAPTLQINDRVLVNKLSYDLHDVNRGDLVVFESPPNEGSETKDLIKRVIGLPGETVESRDGHILIDGQQLEEPYLDRGVTTGALDKITVPPDHLWVMGDNRANSRDSRFFGPIPESLVIGRAFVRVWPITEIGLL
jgi:signal peptidase I